MNEPNTDTTEMIIKGKKYIVKSVMLGNVNKTIQELILNLAEKKALHELGLT